MRTVPCCAFALVLIAAPLHAQIGRDCKYSADRNATIDASGARLLDLESGAGSVRIEGKAGISRVTIRGKACASSADLLDDIKLETRRDGSAIVVRANADEEEDHRGWGERGAAKLDIIVEVPAGMAADIEDGSGEIELAGLGDVTLNDGSGEIRAEGLSSAKIVDGSGELTLVDVRGRVDIRDGSGEIDLREIAGPISIRDGSGEITIRGSKSSVRIEDGSGSIDVADIAGDFVVEDDGSGGIDYENVRGKIDLPRRHH